ncbi:MAG: long-chain fatty acid--CoA ligase [Candidatus Geothermarchaeales archaeon]
MPKDPWFKHWPEGVPQSIEYPKAPLQSFLEESARNHPNHTAILYYGNKITFDELNSLSDRFATILSGLGVSRGDRVALFLPNVPQFVFCFYGALKAGAIVVPCNPLYKERELEHQLRDSESKVVVALDLLYPVVKNIRERLDLTVITTSVKDYLPGLKKLLAPLKGVRKKTFPDTLDLVDLLKRHEPGPLKVEVDPVNDVAVLQYTGGTTGISKGAMLTHYNLVSNALMAINWLPIREAEDVHVAVLPFFHIYGLTTAMNAPVMTSTTMILLPRFDTKSVLQAIEKNKATVFCGVPTMYVALLDDPDTPTHDISTLRGCISGAAPLPVAVMNQFNELMSGNLVEGYGLTEASPLTHGNPLDDIRKVKAGSIGIPVSDTKAKIVDLEKGTKKLPIGEVGELAVKGPQVMLGYWNKPEETKQVFKRGWLLTGDIAKMDKDGYFYIVDRKKDMIDAAGYKVWPRDVEEALYEHPSVKEAAVIGVPDPYRGETVKAFIVPKAEAAGKISEQEIIDFCKERIAAFKVPKQIEFREELPKTLVGKVLRRVLREEEASE